MYDHNYRMISTPGLTFAEKIRDDFIRIPLRNTLERVNLFGHAFNQSDFENQIRTAMTAELHPFLVNIKWAENSFRFTFKKDVPDDVFEEAILICESLGYYGYTYSKTMNRDIPDYITDVDFLKKTNGKSHPVIK